MIMFHNTAIRAQSVIQFKHRNFIEKGLLMLYCLPPLFLIPMYYAAIERMPLNQSINASDWNKNVYKPIALTLVFTSEALATMTDVYLVYKINTFSKRRDRSENTKAKIVAMAHSVYVHYVITWSLLAIDVALKIIIMYGHPLLFDSIVSICTLSMRSKCNLVFGLELKNVLNIKSTIKKSNKSLKSAITRKESVGVKNAPRLSTLQIPKEMELKRSASGKSNDDHPPVHAKPVHANEAVW
jgi:cytochrome bd-type quinol oxidase subunit 2